jgi:nifR3 family TIM-barrel protein
MLQTKIKPLRLEIRNGKFANNEFLIDPPVVLAPMAGITNSAFRTLCREHGAGLYVCEMVTARALIERREETLRLMNFAADESPRSVQLYAVDAATMQKAVDMIGSEDLADHIDMNFGCPVPKVTRRGGGAALPYKRKLFSEIVKTAVDTASKYGIPVTVKMRIGIDDEHETFKDAATIAADHGVAWVALHARTAAQLYDGKANWNAISELVEHLSGTEVPVLGNGDIWSGEDGLKMMQETGCAGVVIGRGCLGRPWLFADLANVFSGRTQASNPTLFQVRDLMFRHAQLLVQYFENEDRAMRDLRKHMAWYLKGFQVNRNLRAQFGMVSSLSELSQLLSQLIDQPYPTAIGAAPRGRTSHARPVTLPAGWLDNPDELSESIAIESDESGSGG